MKTIKATEAARGFGQLVDETLIEPVTIEKNGRPVAVLYSYAEAQQIEALKLDELRRFVDEGIQAVEEGRVRPLTKDFMHEIKEEARKHYRESLKA